MLVGVGAALFVALGEMLVLRFRTYSELMRFDPMRIIEAVVTGVSFLGAGMISVARGHERVKGLTTAASVWTTSAVGIAVGLERYSSPQAARSLFSSSCARCVSWTPNRTRSVVRPNLAPGKLNG